MQDSIQSRSLPGSSAIGVLLVMAAAVALSSTYGPGKTSGAIAASVAVATVLVAAFVGLDRVDLVSELGMVSWVPLVALVGMLAATAAAVNLNVAYSASVVVIGGCGLWGLTAWRPLHRTREIALVAITLVLLAVLATVALVAIDPPKIDVLVGTEAAANALRRGENPYVAVEVSDTNPFAESGSTFEGYFYPPLAMLVYSLSDWIFGDPRWANVLAAAALLLLLVQPWSPKSGRTAIVVLGGALAFVLVPVLAVSLRHGFTEPLALALLGAAILNWRRRPFLAAVLLGLAVASKQYFILLAPLLLLWDDEYRWRRVGIVGAAVLATMLPFVLMDPKAFWGAVIAPALGHDVRPDSLNLIAFGFTPPSWLAATGATVVGVLLARRGGSGPEFGIATAAVLGVAFLFGYQAFSNYWLLVYGLCITTLVAVAMDAPNGEALAADGLGLAKADSLSA